MIRMKLVAATTAVVLGGAVAGLPAAASAAPDAAAPARAPQVASTTLPVTGTLADGSAFTGAISNLTTDVVGGVLQLSGTITGTGLPAGGADFTAPIQDLGTIAGTGTRCDIVTLDLGPLHLDVLGLVIDLDEVHLDIFAVPGAGNLLGNLLCAVAGLLDNPGGGALNGISGLLDRLLRALGLGA